MSRMFIHPQSRWRAQLGVARAAVTRWPFKLVSTLAKIEKILSRQFLEILSVRISSANDSTREEHEDKKTWEIQSLLSVCLPVSWGIFFLSSWKLQLLCPPFFFQVSRSLLLRFSGEVDVLSQVVWAVKCNLLSVASSNMYSTHNISPLSSLPLALRSSTPSLFSSTLGYLCLNLPVFKIKRTIRMTILWQILAHFQYHFQKFSNGIFPQKRILCGLLQQQNYRHSPMPLGFSSLHPIPQRC